MMLLWLVLIGIVIVVLVRCAGKHTCGMHKNSESDTSDLHMLRERYARGEIERDEYLQKKKDLEK